MEGERQTEQPRKLLADAFDKDAIKRQYCIFYVDHLLVSCPRNNIYFAGSQLAVFQGASEAPLSES
jgi:hypothetical protein